MHQGKIKTLFIINRIFENKGGKNITGLIRKHLDRDKFEVDILFSEFPGHAGTLAQENSGKYQIMVAGGGDGTINQVAHSLVHTETILGILPLGSGKGLARSLKIPLNIPRAIRIINMMKLARIDSGLAGGERFFNIADVGFAAEVAGTYSCMQKRGFFSYALSAISTLPGYSPLSAELSIEESTIAGHFFIISFANASQWGYGAHISPQSKPDDQKLEICLVRKFPLILLPVFLARLFLKTMHRSKYVEIVPVKKAILKGDGLINGHVDGEPVQFSLPLIITAEPGSLQVLVP